MYVETIFREVFMDVEYLYWYSIQSDDGSETIDDTPLDEKHLDIWRHVLIRHSVLQTCRQKLSCCPNI